jgi:hypothetical protein
MVLGGWRSTATSSNVASLAWAGSPSRQTVFRPSSYALRSFRARLKRSSCLGLSAHHSIPVASRYAHVRGLWRVLFSPSIRQQYPNDNSIAAYGRRNKRVGRLERLACLLSEEFGWPALQSERPQRFGGAGFVVEEGDHLVASRIVKGIVSSFHIARCARTLARVTVFQPWPLFSARRIIVTYRGPNWTSR